MKRLNKREKFVVPLLLIVLCIFCFAVINFYFNTAEKSVNNTPEMQVADENTDSLNYKIFKDKKGLYGISDYNNNEIISPQWNSIETVSDECFIVSQKINGSQVFGMIDNEENVISAFAYSSLEYVETGLIIGKVAGSGSCMLIKPDGTFYIDDDWDSYSISSDNVTLSKNRNKYHAEINNGKFEFTSMEIKESVNAKIIAFITDFDNYSGMVSHKVIDEIADKSAKYIEAVENDDKVAIRDTTSLEYYTEILPVEYLGRPIESISDAVISLSDGGDKTIYEAAFKLKYIAEKTSDIYSEYAETDIPEETSLNFVISMEKNTDGSMIINSVYYTAI